MLPKKERLGRWKSQRTKLREARDGRIVRPSGAGYTFLSDGAIERMTWRRRYVRLQKFVAKKVLRRQNLGREPRVLDLGCGMVEGVSPAAEDFRKLLRLNKVPCPWYVAVDKHAENRQAHGIFYVKADILEFLKRMSGPNIPSFIKERGGILNPNVIVATRVFEWLGYDRYTGEPSAKAKEFQRLCWERLPEKGVLITDIQLHGVHHVIFPIAVQKMSGKPQIHFFGVDKNSAKRLNMGIAELLQIVSEKFAPPNFDLYQNASGWDSKKFEGNHS
ncbi:MAG: hypothetical protein PHH08_04770 [Candidatus ainarchaeum sp.]|nr:hypothetical protein [Candidatus ainarchaeum sp.]